MNSNKYFVKDDNNIYINSMYAEAYIPESVFRDPEKPSAIASEFGDAIKTVGLFNMRFFDSDETPREEVELKTFNYPNTIETFPESFETLTLEINGIKDRYRVLKYYKGNIMMKSVIQKDSKNCELFLNLLTSGKIPSSLSYDEILTAWIKNFEINNVNPGVPYVTLQIIIATMCRHKENINIPFRKVAGKGNVSMYDYKAVNMNEVSSQSSIFSALTFERFGDKLATSLLMTKEGTEQEKSPVEAVVSM